MVQPADSLFTPTRIGEIDVSNRITMAPLTRSRARMDGVHTPLAIEYYRQRASAGLLISEGTNISEQGRGYAFTPGIYNDEQVNSWRAVTDAVHEAGGKIVVQLWHVGRMSHVSLQKDGASPVGPSTIRGGDTVFTAAGPERPSVPRALETGELAGIVGDYWNAAKKAREAGFDGVEIHAANSYLLDQFLRDSINTRTDRYGGSVENRARLILEVADVVTDVWGAGRVGIRLSPITEAVGETPLDSDPQATYGYLAKRLGERGLAYLHCVEGQTRGVNGARDFDFKDLHRMFGGKYIANNSYDREMAIEAIASGHADLVAFGRPFIGNPDLVERLRLDAPLFEADQATYYGGGAEGYTSYKTLNG